MISSKRKFSSILDFQESSSKQSEAVSQVFVSQSQASFPSSSPSCSAQSSGTVYEIRGIIGESENGYLIDWADDPVTGEVFKADWQPKHNVNSVAVRVWEAKKASDISGVHSATRLSQSQDFSSIDNLGFLQPQRKVRRIEGTFDSTDPSSSESRNSQIASPRPRRARSQPLESSSVPDIIDRVSQHNSSDRELYIAYESSLSTRGTQSISQQNTLQSTGHHSGTSPSQGRITSSVVIPDSQPLPGSSSYIPSTESSSYSLDTFDVRDSTNHIRIRSARTDARTVLVPATQETRRLRRSTSVPLQSIDGSLSTSSKRLSSSLLRSLSDSAYVLASPFQSQESYHLEIPDSTEKPASFFPLNESKSPKDFGTCLASTSSPRTQSAVEEAKGIDSKVNVCGGVEESQNESQQRASQATTTDESTAEDDLPKSDKIVGSSEGERAEHVFHSNSTSVDQNRHLQVPCSTTIFRHTSHSSIEPPAMPESPVRGREGVGQVFANEGTFRNDPYVEQDVEEARLLGLQRRQDPRNSQHISESSRVSQSPISRKLHRHQSSDSELLQDGRQVKLRHSSQDRVRSMGGNSAPPSPTNPKMERLRSQAFPEPHLHSPNKTNRSPQRPAQPPMISSPSASHPNRKHAVISPGPSSPLAQSFNLVPGTSPETLESRASASPSIIPARPVYQVQREPSRLVTQPLELDTTFRQPAPRLTNPNSVPHTPMTPSKLSVHTKMLPSQDDVVLDIYNLSGREHVVPLSMQARIREQYVHTIHHYSRKIKKFFGEKPCQRATVDEINEMLDDICKVTTHIDLQWNTDPSQKNVDPASEAAYAESCSEKFAFLAHFIDRSRFLKINLYIAAKEGVILNILEVFMKAKGVSWTRFRDSGRNDFQRPRDGLAVFLIPADRHHNTSSLNWPEPDAIVGFDETFSMDKIANFHRNTNPPPIIRLVVYASLEHIDLCIPRDLHIIERLRRLTYCLLQTQKRVGVLEEHRSSRYAAEMIAPFVQAHSMKRPDRGWPIPPIQPIDDISILTDSDTRLSDVRSDITQSDGPLRQWPEPDSGSPQEGVTQSGPRNGKRAYDIEPGDNLETQVKKLKMGPLYRSEIDPILTGETRENLAYRLQSAGRKIETLQQDLEKNSRLTKDMRDSAEVRQYEFENLRKENGDLAFKNKEIETLNLSLEQRIQSLNARQQSHIEAKEELRNKVVELQTQLTTHPNEHISARAQLQSDLDTKTAELWNMQKTWTTLQTTHEFTRQEYQNASTRAAELSREVEILKAEITELRRQADSNVVAVQKMQQEDMNTILVKEVEGLKEAIKQRDLMLWRVEADNLELKRGRAGVQTRGSSQQPRSPRAVAAGRESRGVSPAPGLLGGGGSAMVRGGSGLGNRLSAREG